MLFNFIKKTKQKYIDKKNRDELSKIYSDYRYANALSTKSLINALKKSENINEEIENGEIVKIFTTSENIMSLGLSIYLISRLKIQDEKICNSLLSLLEHEDELVRRISAILLTELGTVESLNAVVAGSRHGHSIRTQAAWKLKEMGTKASAAIPGLIALLRYKKINCRTHAAAQCALSEMGEDAKNTLINLINDEDKTMREHAATTLKMMNPSKEIQEKINKVLSQKE